MPQPAWQKACEAKRAKREALIPTEWRLKELPPVDRDVVLDIPKTSGILTEKELAITEQDDVAALLTDLATGKLTALEVTTAYCKRAAIAHQLLNTSTEILFESALARAKELDDHFAKHKKPVGPLHGLPISLKEQFDIEGVEMTMGYASWIGRYSSKDAVSVALLKRAGAVIHTRTNLPQTIMWGETDNHVWGLTVNAFRRNLTCGGSSGGEGGLVGFKGSPVGFGTDIAGSIRVPAAYQGLYGLRPTMRRLPYEGASNSLLGLEAISSVIGPMSRSLSGLIATAGAIISQEPWNYDPATVPIPWRPELLKVEGKLSLAIIEDDGYVQPQPPIKRAIRETAEALRAAGHEGVLPRLVYQPEARCRTVSVWTCESHPEMDKLAFAIYYADGGQDFKEVTKESGEPYHPILPFEYRPSDKTKLSAYEAWQLNIKRDGYRKAFLDRYQAFKTSTGRPLDGIIAPVSSQVGARHGTLGYVGYTSVWNLLDRPCVVFPVLDALDVKLDPVDKAFKAYNKDDQRMHNLYSPEELQGPPVALQVAGHRFQEERLLGIAGEISRVLGRNGV